MKINLHQSDLPDDILFTSSVAIDTETMGLKPHRDRLCLVQLYHADHGVHMVQIKPHDDSKTSPNLMKLLSNPHIQKIFHYARVDVMQLQKYFSINISNIYCTKIASKLVRTYSSRHGLKEICRELLAVDLDKGEQTSDWGKAELTKNQLRYAAHDVYHLHRLQDQLNIMLEREGRMEIAQACFDFLPMRANLDVLIGEEYDVFSYKGD